MIAFNENSPPMNSGPEGQVFHLELKDPTVKHPVINSAKRLYLINIISVFPKPSIVRYK